LKLAPAGMPRLNEVNLSGGVLLFALAVSILTGVIFGLAPALQAARRHQVAELREGSRGAGSSKHQIKVSRVLLTCEIALSLVLLIGAGLLLRSFWHLLSDLLPDRIFVMPVPPRQCFTDERHWLAFAVIGLRENSSANQRNL
jgi:H+/gluconate symporter-like permease